MEKENIDVLLLDEQDSPILVMEECKCIQPVIREFMKCFVQNKDKPVVEWLEFKLQEQLPEKNTEEIHAMSNEIIMNIEISEAKRISLTEAIQDGRSKESWFAAEVAKATSAMSMQEAADYLKKLDHSVQAANDSLYRTITTQAGTINRNPRLDGFIAEQYHAQTFNMNAEAKGSPYRAKVLEPNGNGYTKNSVDLVVVDSNGKVVRRYQSKYCKDVWSTEQAFKNGDYRGQQKLVAEEQIAGMKTKATIVIEAPDGTSSNPLSKSAAERMRDEAQSGNWDKLDWNEYKTKDLAIGMGKQVGYAAIQGAVIGVGFDVAKKLWNGEEVQAEEVVETALLTGADFGVKAAAAGAMKVGVEKGIISVIPKGTPAGVIANMAFVAVEDAKIVEKMVTGELSAKEGVEKLEQTTVATAAGLVAMGKGATVGASLGAVLGPAGSALGGFIGGTVAYMAGSKIGETVVKGAQKLRDGALEVVKEIGAGIKSACSSVISGISNIGDSIASFFGW